MSTADTNAETRVTDVPQHVLDYLGAQKTLTLATASPTGVPRAATLTYVNEGPTLYFWSRPDTTTARHIEHNPVVSFTIDDYAEDWRRTKGIQGTGEARLMLSPAEVRSAVDLFHKKFSAVEADTPANILFFRVTPTELQFIDSSAAAHEEQAQAIGTDYSREVVYSVFSDLPREEVAAVAGQMRTVKVGAGDVVVRQGAPADKFFIIVDGEVEVVHEDGGAERIVNTLGPGQFFGEMAILRDKPRAATVRSRTETTLLAMERSVFRGLVAQSLGVTEEFDRVIHERLEQLEAGESG